MPGYRLRPSQDKEERKEVNRRGRSMPDIFQSLQPVYGWACANWLTLVLTGQIIGAVVAVKYGHYRKGIFWLLIALATIWIKGMAR